MKNKGLFDVVITDCDHPSVRWEEEELAGIAAVRRLSCVTEDDVLEQAREADALIVQYAPITKRVIDGLRRCRVISRYGIGIDMIDTEAAKSRNIPVMNVPDYCIEEVSDHVLALALAGLRRIVFLDSGVRAGVWDAGSAGAVRRMKNLTFGLAGFGNIPRLTARKLSGFGCAVVAHDPFVDPAVFAVHGVEPVSFGELAERSDILSIHLPLNAKTRRIFGAPVFRCMKEGSLLINTSRGGVVDEDALAAALESGRPAGACLDVFEKEPPSPDNPLLKNPAVIATPHSAFYSLQSREELQKRTARNVAGVLRPLLPRED